jgi:hypothetical protein
MSSPPWEGDEGAHLWVGLKLFHPVLFVLGAVFLLELAFHRVPHSNSSQITVAISVMILGISTILVWIADHMLESAVFTEEIHRLIEAAEERLGGRDEPLYRVNWLQLYTVCCAAVIAIFGLILIGWEAWTPQSRPVWLALMVVTVAEAVILAWTFEHVAMKQELEALAVARREKFSLSPMAKLDIEVAKRVHQLRAALDIRTCHDENTE